MASLNKVFLIGRLGKDPEVRHLSNGKSVVNATLATTESFKDQKKTEWHRVVFFGPVADNIAKYCKKGSQIYVEGKNQTREWQSKEGHKNYTTEIICFNSQFLDSKPAQQPQQPARQQAQSQTPSFDQPEFMDDIPF